MDIAIFWLPLIGGLLLGGVAISGWYGGDKSFGLWIGFTGLILFLLVAAIQIQQFIWQNVNQPDIDLVASTQRAVLKWNPSKGEAFTMFNEGDQLPRGHWAVPKLKLKNKSTYNALDAKISWSVAPYDLRKLLESPSLQKKNIAVLPGSQVQVGNTIYDVTQRHDLPIIFITRDTDTFIPLNIWINAALFFAASLPPEPGSHSPTYFLDAVISWNIPDGGQPKRLRVKATATNMGPAGGLDDEFSALIDFEVEQRPQ
ncbi:hypothetical protein [Afipia sp. Root123D2]|uniref:hypothetical protein n=1 Tax=Afipia sp. Root123D2 TaxID=1736436 RepID=UPI000AC84DE5|nr:hypothetical protein [Afipia sp. Root123D2]